MLPEVIGVALVVVLIVLDLLKKLRLDHPAWVAATGILFPAGFCWSGLCLVVWLLGGTAPGGAWACLATTLLGVYVLVVSHIRPFLSSGEKTGRRLLTGGLIQGLLLQGVLGCLYIMTAILLRNAVDGPLWMMPFYPLALLVLWPAMHLVFHVAIAAIAIDPLLLLAGGCIGILWAVQVSFLIHGAVRAMLQLKKSGWKWVLYLLFTLVPVVNLICAGRLLWQLMRESAAAKEETKCL